MISCVCAMLVLPGLGSKAGTRAENCLLITCSSSQVRRRPPRVSGSSSIYRQNRKQKHFLKCPYFLYGRANLTENLWIESVKTGWTRKCCIKLVDKVEFSPAGELLLAFTSLTSLNLGRVRLGSIRNKNNWNNASKHLDFHSGYSAPRRRIARIYSGIYSYSGISQRNAPLEV